VFKSSFVRGRNSSVIRQQSIESQPRHANEVGPPFRVIARERRLVAGQGRIEIGNALAIEKFAVTIGRMKKIISTNEAPAAIGPYSQAVRSGRFLFCSGQIPLDPKSGKIVSGDIAAQTRRVLDNIAAVLRAEALSFENIVKTTIFLTDLNDFQVVNEIYGSYFKQDPPARSTVQVSALPKDAHVEIEVIAVVDENEQTAYDTSG
jgi:2-iminobutanoate/2-iminopropanoate deaminase